MTQTLEKQKTRKTKKTQTNQERREAGRVYKSIWLEKEIAQKLSEMTKKHCLTEKQVIQIALQLVYDTDILSSTKITKDSDGTIQLDLKSRKIVEIQPLKTF